MEIKWAFLRPHWDKIYTTYIKFAFWTRPAKLSVATIDWVSLKMYVQRLFQLMLSVLSRCAAPDVLQQMCCTRCAAPDVLHPKCCTRCGEPAVLQLKYCTRCGAPDVAQPMCCTWCAAPDVLHPMCCTRCAAPEVLHPINLKNVLMYSFHSFI